MKYFLLGLALSAPGVALAEEPIQKAMSDTKDIGALTAAHIAQCGELDPEATPAFLGALLTIMTSSQDEFSDETVIEVQKRQFFEAFMQAKGYIEENGCVGFNAMIDDYEGGMNYMDSLYDLYTPLDSL
jgi:hypothetical protein